MRNIYKTGGHLLLLAIGVLLMCEAVQPNLLLAPGAAGGSIQTAVMQGGDWQTAADAQAQQDILRLHIVANSDREEDQRVKLLVRDALLETFAPANSLKQAEELLLLGGEDLQSVVETVLYNEGCTYGAQLRFGRMEFPARNYAEVEYPAGEYEALRVELGESAGQNWWCVLFPPLCILDIAAEDLPDTDEIVFESDIVRWLSERE